MAAPVLRVNGRDFSPFMQLQHEDGLDPIDVERSQPQFTGQPALVEGQTYVGSAIANRHWSVPLVLDAADRPALVALITAMNQDLVRGAQVEYCHDPTVDASSYFFLEKGQLKPKYEYFLANAATTRAVLELWTRPFAGTATMRTVASFQATGPQQFGATGILGDTWALTNTEIRVGSAVASAGRVIGLGVHRSASFRGVRQPSTGGVDAGQASSVVVGASGAIGSQYLGIPVSPTAGASGVALRSYLTPPEGHTGRHRILLVARSGLRVGIPLYAVDRFGAVLGPTAIATQTDQTKWGLVDLGEIQVAARASGQEAVPTQEVNIFAGGPSGAIINASPALQVDGLIYLPLDVSPALLRTAGAAGQAAGNNYQDNFDRLTGAGGKNRLNINPNAEPGPGVWTALIDGVGAYGLGVAYSGGLSGQITAYAGSGEAKPNATAAALLASGAALGDFTAQLDVQLYNALGATAASMAQVELWTKVLPPATYSPGVVPSAYIGGRLTLAPSSLQSVALIVASAGNVAVVASAALTASVASAVMGGLRHTMTIQLTGASAQLALATAGVGNGAIISGSHALHGMAGNPGLFLRTPSYAAGGALYVDNFEITAAGGSAPDILAREWFRFEAHPELRCFQGNASVYVADRSDFRGVPLRLPPTGSSMPSGPPQVVAFQGEVDNFVGNDLIDVRLDVMDRFEYLR